MLTLTPTDQPESRSTPSTSPSGFMCVDLYCDSHCYHDRRTIGRKRQRVMSTIVRSPTTVAIVVVTVGFTIAAI